MQCALQDLGEVQVEGNDTRDSQDDRILPDTDSLCTRHRPIQSPTPSIIRPAKFSPGAKKIAASWVQGQGNNRGLTSSARNSPARPKTRPAISPKAKREVVKLNGHGLRSNLVSFHRILRYGSAPDRPPWDTKYQYP